MPARSQIVRSSVRRSGSAAGGGGGVTSINGLSGALSLVSPMLTTSGSTFRLENTNPKALTDQASISGIDADVNTSFELSAAAARTFQIPTNARDGRLISFMLKNNTGGVGVTHTWTGGAGGYAFANAAVGANGIVKLTDYTTLAALVPDQSAMSVGFRYYATLDRWVAVGLAGYWL